MAHWSEVNLLPAVPSLLIILKKKLLYKHQWNTKWAFVRKLKISLHVKITCLHLCSSSLMKRSPSLWLHNKSRLIHWCLYNKINSTCVYYMPAYGYEFYLLMFNAIPCLFVALTREISSWMLEDKIHIHAWACNSLYYSTFIHCMNSHFLIRLFVPRDTRLWRNTLLDVVIVV